MADTGTMTVSFTAGGATRASVPAPSVSAAQPATPPPRAGFYSCAIGWTSDSSGAVINTNGVVLSGICMGAVFVPGSGAALPTALYDVTLIDAQGLDVLGGLGADLGTVTSAMKAPGIIVQESDGATATMPRPMDGALTLNVSNAGSGKSGSVVLIMKK